MKFFKEKFPIIIGVVMFILISGFAYYYVFEKDYMYFTQIDNDKIREITPSGGMKYEYKLRMYDESGNDKMIRFKTSRVLKEDAYLKVKYYFISGVNKWEEVTFDELPEKVKKHYENN